MDSLKLLLSQNQRDRIAKESAAQNRISDPILPRHTTYQGDRKIQQLGGEIIENGIVLNNQSLAIGDVVMPLAKGNVLRRVDNTNGGALLGTAYRDAIENDVDANGNRRNSVLSRNGGNGTSGPINPNNNSPIDKNTHPIFPPPYGCTPPPTKCFWTTNPTPPDGFQSHGSAVVNENAVPLYLHCIIGSSVPKNLNCSFLDKWKCSGGVCSPDENGIYNSQAECEAALVPPLFTGGQCVGIAYNISYSVTVLRVDGGTNTIVGTVDGLSGDGTFGPITNIFIRRPTSFVVQVVATCNNYSSVAYDRILDGSSTPAVASAFFTSLSVVRRDGLADTCGSLPLTCPI